MRVSNALAFMALLAAPAAADAVIIVVYTEPMSLEQRTVVLGSPGPDRLIHCSAPPAVRQCREVPIKRKR
jgi:hypothetical protein